MVPCKLALLWYYLFLFKGDDGVEIYNMALVFIYPDGYVDSIPIREDWDDHIDYFREYLRTSPRFQKIVEENDFHFDWENEINTYPICLLLALNNVILFYNLGLPLIVEEMDMAEDLSHFVIYLPDDYKHHLGLDKAKKEIRKLDDNHFEIERYLSAWHITQEFDTEEYEAFFKNKNEIEEKEKEKQL